MTNVWTKNSFKIWIQSQWLKQHWSGHLQASDLQLVMLTSTVIVSVSAVLALTNSCWSALLHFLTSNQLHQDIKSVHLSAVTTRDGFSAVTSDCLSVMSIWIRRCWWIQSSVCQEQLLLVHLLKHLRTFTLEVSRMNMSCVCADLPLSVSPVSAFYHGCLEISVNGRQLDFDEAVGKDNSIKSHSCPPVSSPVPPAAESQP